MKINYKMHSGQVTADAHSRIFCAHDAYAVETYRNLFYETIYHVLNVDKHEMNQYYFY